MLFPLDMILPKDGIGLSAIRWDCLLLLLPLLLMLRHAGAAPEETP